jgi:hypothetical protein
MSDESLEKQAITWHERRKRVIGIWLARNPQNGANVNYFEQFTNDELLLLERAYRATENQFKHKADQCHCVRQSRSAELVEQQRQRISALEAQLGMATSASGRRLRAETAGGDCGGTR